MKKILLILVSISVVSFAGFSKEETERLAKKAEKIRKELNIYEPTAKEKKIADIRRELNIEYDISSKEAMFEKVDYNDYKRSVVQKKPSRMQRTLDSAYAKINKTLNLEDEIDEGYSLTGTLNDFYDTVGLDKGESWGMPSLFGLNAKKKKKSSIFGLEFLGGLKDTGTSLHKGMKYSGQSAEFASGMMYKSSKVYNTMFGMYEDSPFNFFEEEEESSIFDVFEGGNDILDMFD
jgi:hypothetical protein